MLRARSFRNSRLFCAAIFVSLALCLCSCSSRNYEHNGSFSDDSSAVSDTVTFTDALGRTVSVSKTPKRVAALIGSFADVWLLSGGDICATAEDAWDDFSLELPNAVNIGGAHSPNAEKLLAASPEFVLASASTASNVSLMETLEGAGITVAYFDVDSVEDYLEMLRICTEITGRHDLYERNGVEIKDNIDQVKADFSSCGYSANERTVLLLRVSSGFVKAKGSKGTVLGEMLADLGCINIADSDTSLLEDLSIEAIIRQQPYRIFVVTMGDATEKAKDNFYSLINDNTAWSSLEAVQCGRIHFMDRKLFNIKPNAKWAISYEQLCDIFKNKE